MEIAEIDDTKVYQEKMGTRVALLEQSQESTFQSLLKIEKKLDIIESKIDKTKREIYSNLRWIINITLTTFIAVVSISISVYQYVKIKG